MRRDSIVLSKCSQPPLKDAELKIDSHHVPAQRSAQKAPVPVMFRPCGRVVRDIWSPSTTGAKISSKVKVLEGKALERKMYIAPPYMNEKNRSAIVRVTAITTM